MYDMFALDIIESMLDRVYGKEDPTRRSSPSLHLSMSELQVCHENGVGFMIDIIGSSGQAPTVGTVGTLITWRFIVHTLLLITLSLPRGRHMTAVLAFQGGGQSAYRNEIVEAPYSALKSVDCCWGHIIGSGGCISGFVALYLSLTIPDTHSFIMEIERYVAVAAKDV
ncbi:hypothetical protein F5141DRAFT_1219138 [Pisolithus sp. B1]|nr:hypothetical protein F5141DRAFT_1219138 [Pisolithus sp. B1]